MKSMYYLEKFIFALILFVFNKNEYSLFTKILVLSFFLIFPFFKANLKEESKLDNRNKFKSHTEKEFYEDILSKKNSWWVKYDLETDQIVDKSINSRKLPLSEIFFEMCETKLNIENMNLELQEKFLLEKLLKKIMIPSEKNESKSEDFCRYKNLELKSIIQNLDSRFQSEDIGKENFKKVGWIINENNLSFNLLEVFFKKTPNQERVFEIIFLGSEYPKNIFNSNNSDLKKKSIQMCKVAHEIKNIVLTMNDTCKQYGKYTSKSSKFYESSHYRERKKIDENSNKYSINNYLQLKESFAFIYSLSNHLIFLIEDLNTFAKSENDLINHPKQSEEIELIPELNFCLDIFKNKKSHDKNKGNLQIYSNYQCKRDIKINTNKTRLKQILINLLSNAYKFTVSGKIILGVKYIENKKIRISVSDTGCGIPEDEQRKLFNPFIVVESNQHLNLHGSGLGLSIVKEFLAESGSKLELTSSKNEGSTFWFDLDYCACSASQFSSSLPSICSSDSDSIQNETVIYDKNIILNQSLKKFLEHLYDNDTSSSKYFSINNYIVQSNANDIFMGKNFSHINREELKKSNSKFRNCKKSFETESENKKSVENVIIDCNSDNDLEENHLIFSNDKLDNPFESNSREFPLNTYLKNNFLNTSQLIQDEPKIKFKRVKKSRFMSNTLDKKFEEMKNSEPKELNIVVCDDEKTILYSTANLIRKVTKNHNLNVNLITCNNGIECIYKVYEEYKNGQFIDMIFVDESMPFIRGSLLCKIIKTMSNEKQINDIKVYIVTAYEDEEHIKIIKSSDCDGIINKPISKYSLENVFK